MASKPDRTFLVFAASNDARIGVTGAAIGTEVVIDSLRDRFQIETIWLRTNGLGQIGARGFRARLNSNLGAAWASVEALARLARRGLFGPRVDLIYMLPAASRMGILRNAAAVLVIQCFHRKSQVVLHIRNGNYFEAHGHFLDAVSRYVNRRATTILILSERLLPSDLTRSGVNMDHVCVLPNTIDAALIPETETKQRDAPPPVRVLYLSNFIAEKGYLTLLQAAERLLDMGLAKRFSLTFRGKWLSENDRTEFEARAAALSKRGLNVSVGGSVAQRSDVRALYAGHHVFCLPTSYAAEAQPRSILEAMANSCTVVATRYRSIPDMVVHGETGMLIDRQDPAQLAEALASFTDEDLARMGAAGSARFRAQFSAPSIEKRLHRALDVAMQV